MKLYTAPPSPYARMVQVVIAEKGLQDRVEIIEVQPRVPDSPYYQVNPSGRVPYLVRADGVGMEESALICAYLDHMDGSPVFALGTGDADWEVRRLEAMARSTMDGLAVWRRELGRREKKRSSFVIGHESARFDRLASAWEHELDNSVLQGSLNMAQITLACALGFGLYVPGFDWRPNRPRLQQWHERMCARPSFAMNPNPPMPSF